MNPAVTERARDSLPRLQKVVHDHLGRRHRQRGKIGKVDRQVERAHSKGLERPQSMPLKRGLLFPSRFVALAAFFREHPLSGCGFLRNAPHAGLQRIILSTCRSTIAASRRPHADIFVSAAAVLSYHAGAGG